MVICLVHGFGIKCKEDFEMATFTNKVSAALIIIEKCGANLHDDTYLDKTISGLNQELELIPEKEKVELFLKDTSIERFCWKNFESEECELQDFVFKLCKISCERLCSWTEKVCWFTVDSYNTFSL